MADRRIQDLIAGSCIALDMWLGVRDKKWSFLSPPGLLRDKGIRTGQYKVYVDSKETLADAAVVGGIYNEALAVAIVDEGRFPDGLFHREVDFESYYEFFDDEIVKPLKKDVIRLRRKLGSGTSSTRNLEKGRVHGTEVGPSQTGKKPSKKELEEDWELDVGFYRPRFPRLVRDYLNSGVLASLIRMHRSRARRF
ncbi:hypothetical protein F5883DRAFT_636999 [Diaporthe sp. PMI_573]|nr:hypothetical protein F5883DRAFT_636999 [Diaporthaceae sp. PMI_573]